MPTPSEGKLNAGKHFTGAGKPEPARKFSIKFKLLFSFALIGLITSIVVSLRSYSAAQELVDARRRSGLVATRNIKADQVKTAVNSLISDLFYFSKTYNMTAAFQELENSYYATDTSDAGELEACEALLKEHYNDLTTDPSFKEDLTNILPTAPEGKKLQCQLIVNRGRGSAPIIINSNPTFERALDRNTRYFNTFSRNHWVTDILIIDNKSNVIYSTNLYIDFGANLEQNFWKNTPLGTAYKIGKILGPSEAPRFFDFSSYFASGGTPTAFVAAPIFDKSSRLGVIIASLTPAFFDHILNTDWEANGLEKTGETYLVGRDRLLRSNTRFFMENKELNQPSLRSKVTTKFNTAALFQTMNPVVSYSLFDEKTEGVIYAHNYMHLPTLTAYAPLDLGISGIRWGIVTEISISEALAPLQSLRQGILQNIAVILVFILLFTLYISKAITRPLRDLEEAVERVAEGDYGFKINDNSTDELGAVARAFDLMSDTIRQHSLEITEKNNSLQAEKDFVEEILDSQTILLMITDESKIVVRVNNRMEKSTGLTKDEMEGTQSTFLFGIDYPKYIDAALKARGGEPTNFIADITAKNGIKSLINWHVSVMNNRIDRLLWMGIDITEQQEVKEKLRVNESMMEFLTNNIQDAIFISDDNAQVISWNTSAEDMFGYKLEEILLESVVPKLIPKTYENQLFSKGGHNSKQGNTLEVECIRKNGEVFIAEAALSHILQEGRWNTMFAVRDISTRIKREQDLKNALDTAKSAEKAKSEFLANMSHEIRTPLNGIIGFLDLLKQTKMDDTQGEYLKIINSSAASLLSIINEILDYSKLESGKMQIESVEFNIYEELESISELYTAKAAEKDIALHLNIDTEIPAYVIGDPLRIRQIISNLLSNAIKFTGVGGVVTLSAKLINISNSEYLTSISVKDTGIGISEEKQRGIFEAFSQADSSVTRKYGGTGLGLAISSRFAHLMGSRLQLSSREGEGSTFWFDVRFPVLRDSSYKNTFMGLIVGILKGDNFNYDEEIMLRYLKYLGCETKIIPASEAAAVFGSGELFHLVIADTGSIPQRILEEISEIIQGSCRLILFRDSDMPASVGLREDAVVTAVRPVHITKLISLLDSIMTGRDGKKKDLMDDIRFAGKVLVAEDNPVNQQLIKIILVKLGFEVDMASDGKEAYNKFTEGEYDLIFMDFHMPVMDGITATKMIIAREKEFSLTHTPIIALTANVVEESRSSYKEAGMDGFLAKPVVLIDLVMILKEFLRENVAVSEHPKNLSPIAELAEKMHVDDAGFVRLLVEEFVNVVSEKILEIQMEIANGDFETPLVHCEVLKGVALNLHYEQIDSILSLFETYCRNKDRRTAEAQLEVLAKEVYNIKTVYLN
ncbi:MAG: PAS domain S-box protein [Deferribacteraceae bacterium]|jgi:PAS domain S-box-containing protein|nr:PAS domain S-box protein [Deferribacteraceae bacterium]